MGVGMADPLQCADQAISNFVRYNVGSPPWPNWSNLKPGDTQNGWNASPGEWRGQGRAIIGDFEACMGITIVHNNSHLNSLRMRTLTTFRDYLVEQAGVAIARAELEQARANLASARAAASTTQIL